MIKCTHCGFGFHKVCPTEGCPYMADDSKRSDFPCPGIISGRSRSTSQARETRAIQAGVEAKLERRASSKAREQHKRNEDFLAQKRRDIHKGRRS